MSMKIPAVGDRVLYTLSDYDAESINRSRADAVAAGAKVHGNSAAAGDVYPMDVVRVWGNQPGAAINGQVILDGNDTFWATSRCGGDLAGQYRWPERG